MAVQAPVNYLARRLSGAIRSFAAAQGLSVTDYSIAGTFDGNNERFYLLVGSDRSIDEGKWHSGIMRQIRKDFADVPSITSRIILVIRNVSRIDQVYHDLIVGDGEIDITEAL